ncbi:hypothetical protein SLEP1_g40639 [Rubroshorea leprosula]|uniref:Uncharacterized protein n=1 Tax=Rubroshorea leprosula TaxID=152421 RepID=A0AAV5L416_9ROSI|nr:hypothetical protein SLEP1_g40639 [Rubroshorea leprosula]
MQHLVHADLDYLLFFLIEQKLIKLFNFQAQCSTGRRCGIFTISKKHNVFIFKWNDQINCF